MVVLVHQSGGLPHLVDADDTVVPFEDLGVEGAEGEAGGGWVQDGQGKGAAQG